MKIRTFIFLDLETTGLIKPIEISEITLVAIQRKHLKTKTEVLPRVVDKITFCVRPVQTIESVASSITGLYQDVLENKCNFDIHLGQIVLGFIERQLKPVCFIAHNGDNYDFDILSAEMRAVGLSFQSYVYIADSLKGMREIRKSWTQGEDMQNAERTHHLLAHSIKDQSLKLQNLISILLTDPIPSAHTAESDALNLAKIVSKFQELILWFDQNARHINTINIKNNLALVKSTKPDEETSCFLQDQYFEEMDCGSPLGFYADNGSKENPVVIS